MESLVFAYLFNQAEQGHNLIFPYSLRKYGGNLAGNRVMCLVPENWNIDQTIRSQLGELDVELVPITVDEQLLEFPLALFPIAAAWAEQRVERGSILAWQTVDTVILQEPHDFRLPESVICGYRPVHHTVVGQLYDQPLDRFWRAIYDLVAIPKRRIFPMTTHIDGNSLRPYFNAGCVVVRTEYGLLQSWSDLFRAHYQDERFKYFYSKNPLYAIFMHQAILSVALLAKVEVDQFHELPKEYNYPLHLHESGDNQHPQDLQELITARYDNSALLQNISGPLKFKQIIAEIVEL